MVVIFDFYTISIAISIFAMLSMLVCVYSSSTLSKSNKHYFKLLFIVVAVSAFCECLGVHLNGTDGATRILHTAVKAVELSIASAIAILITFVIEKRNQKIIATFLLLHSLIEVLSGFFGFIYRVDENSNYTHESLYWIYTAAYFITILYAMYIIIHNMKKFQYHGIVFFCMMSLSLLFGIVVQVCNSDLKVIFVSTAIASIMLYVFNLEMVQQNDELTGLINRRGYENYTSHIENKCVLLMFDVDNFKDINDKYGHRTGDECLAEIGSILRMTYAKYGRCYRIGGDEFCVIAEKKIEQTESINSEFFLRVQQSKKQYEWMPRIAMGYVHFDPQTDSIHDSINEADRLMYQNKKNHKAEQNAPSDEYGFAEQIQSDSN